jgi:tetratricopeptide (TPR) repeat protein
MSGLLALGLAIDTERRRTRFIWLGVFGMCAVGVLLSLSRGGIAAFTFGLLFLLLNLLRNHLKAPRSERAKGLAVGARWVGVALAFVAIASVFMADRLVRRFSEATSYRLKINIWPSAIDAFVDFWRTGMGRGAFEVAFTRFMPDHLGKTYTHPENFILQLITEVGVISIPLILLAGFALFHQWRGAVQSPTNLSVISAALALAVHNLFDFNLEYWGVALPLFVALGVSAATHQKAWVFKVPIKPVAYVAAGILGVALYFGNDDLRKQESELVTFYRNSSSSAEVQAKALSLIDRHPANYLPYTIAAAGWVEKQPVDPRQAIAFTNRSLYLFPRDFVAHQVTAKALRRLGKRPQAFLEYRLSYESAFDAPAILDECAQLGQNASELLECVPARVDDVSSLINLAARHHPQETGDACIQALNEMPLESSTPALAAQCAKQLLSIGRREDASALLDSVAQKMKDPSELAMGRAEVLCERNRCDQGVALLEEALQKSPTHFEITRELASRYIRLKRYEAARAIVVRTAAVTVDTPRRAALKVVEGEVDSALGQWDRAFNAFRIASSLEPTSARHYMASEALMRLRKVDDAWAELRAGQRLDSQDGAQAAEQRLKQMEPSASVQKMR